MRPGSRLRLSELGPILLIDGHDNSMTSSVGRARVDGLDRPLSLTEETFDLDTNGDLLAIVHDAGLSHGPPSALTHVRGVSARRVGLTREACLLGQGETLWRHDAPELRYDGVVDFACAATGVLASAGDRLFELDARGALVDEHVPAVGVVRAVGVDEIAGGWLLATERGVFGLRDGVVSALSGPVPAPPEKVRRGPRAVWLGLPGGRLVRAAPGDAREVAVRRGLEFDANARGAVLLTAGQVSPLEDDATLGT